MKNSTLLIVILSCIIAIILLIWIAIPLLITIGILIGLYAFVSLLFYYAEEDYYWHVFGKYNLIYLIFKFLDWLDTKNKLIK